MYSSTLVLGALATLAASAPLAAPSTYDPDYYFHVSNFVFGCTTTCDWSYDVAVTNSSSTHPAGGPVHCKGSTGTVDSFQAASGACEKLSDSQKIATFISKDNILQIQYRFDQPATTAVYWYEGNSSVNAATSGRPQATDFFVKETLAYAVA